jgi:hypothetical protein
MQTAQTWKASMPSEAHKRRQCEVVYLSSLLFAETSCIVPVEVLIMVGGRYISFPTSKSCGRLHASLLPGQATPWQLRNGDIDICSRKMRQESHTAIYFDPSLRLGTTPTSEKVDCNS